MTLPSHAPEPATHVIVGTAGHIDHGKTALVYALTGTDTDRLPEEKHRGITIDLGFADLQLRTESGDAIDISLIDVPGHHAFIRNMLAGAGGIDCVVLVIAADEGIKPQTEEHLAICALLGVRRGIVALTKCDLVDSDQLQRTRSSVAASLHGTFLEHAPILPVSSLTGQGIPELKQALRTIGVQRVEQTSALVPRLPVDRVFSLRGFGTIITGTLHGGRLHAGNELQLYPSARSVRIRGMQVHRNNVASVSAPCRVALNLSGVQVAEVSRGDTLVPPGTLAGTREIAAELSMLPGRSLPRHRSTIRLHAFSAESIATVLRYETDPQSASGLVRLKLANPMVLLPGDRFVLRQTSPALTIGGGRVLDAHPVRARKAESHRWLMQLRNASPEEAMYLRVSRRGAAGITATELTRETGLLPHALLPLLQRLLASRRVISTGGTPEHFVAAQALEQTAQQLLGLLQNTTPRAASRAELRSRSRLSAPMFDLALRTLAERNAVSLASDTISIPGSQSPSQQSSRIAAIEELFQSAGLASPLLSEVSSRLSISPQDLHPAITQLLRAKKIVRMGADNLFIHTDALAALVARLRHHRGERFDVAWFKSFTGLTRKHAIPLLEYLDGQRVTRNDQGVRVTL